MTIYLKWVWQQPDWPRFHWDEPTIQALLRAIRQKQGVLLGKMGALSPAIPSETSLDMLLRNIISSSAIEGEQLNIDSVRSSLAKRMSLHLKPSYPTTERSEGLAQMMLDAVGNLDIDLSYERLQQWHIWLFPSNLSSTFHSVIAGQLRGEEPMQVVSGRIDKPKVHFEAPPRASLDYELQQFIDWFNQSLNDRAFDPLLRAAICHFWFVTIHPFEDGNGRITRALTDLALAQDDKQSIRLYAMSQTILENRKDYYHILEQSQRHTTDITQWLTWFFKILEASMQSAINTIDQTLNKSRFWQFFQNEVFSKEQKMILNQMLDDASRFSEGISAAQYKKMTRVSKATATRHLKDLLDKGCLEKLPAGGRSTRYRIKNCINF